MADAYEDFFKSLGETLKRKRVEAGLTQRQLGEQTGKPQSAIARIESGGNADVHLRVLYELLDAMKVGMDEFFSEVISLGTVKADNETDQWTKMKARIDLLNDEEKNWFAKLVEHCLTR
jgi:transcriptional regulator with XRE-family HTH domain